MQPTIQTDISTPSLQRRKTDRAISAATNPFLIRREINNRSLYEFLKYFWPEISNHIYIGNWHIKYLCEELEKIAYRVGNREQKMYDLLVNIPPGTTKTIISSIMYPAWCWTKWFWMRFITASYSAALALESAEYCRDLIRSERFRMIYPELDIKQDKDTKSNFKVVKKEVVNAGRCPRTINGGNRYSTSVGGTLMGFHGDIIIWDDALNPTEAVSEKELANTNRWIDQVLPTRKTDKAISVIVGIMQRLHQDDPAGHILKKKNKKLKHISLPGEIRNYREKVHPTELIDCYQNDLLDVNRLTWENLKDLEADLGQYGYAGQIGQDPTPPGGGMFKVDHFQIIDHLSSETNVEMTIRYWDKAGTEGAGAYTVGVKMSRLKNGKFVVRDVKRGQWGTDTREDIIRQTAEADGRDVRVVHEQEPGSGGKESAEGTTRNLAGYTVEADKRGGKTDGNKSQRADAYSVQVNWGNVILIKGDWNHEFIEEHRFFPFSTYKDQVDAGAGAFNKLTGKKLVRVM